MNLSKITWPKELVRLHRLHWITDVRNWLLHNSPKISIIKTDLSLNRKLKCGKCSVYHDPNSENGSFGTWPLSSRSATRSLAMGHLFLKVFLSFNKTISSSVKSLYCRITFVSDVLNYPVFNLIAPKRFIGLKEVFFAYRQVITLILTLSYWRNRFCFWCSKAKNFFSVQSNYKQLNSKVN